jgi:hypothetical protein
MKSIPLLTLLNTDDIKARNLIHSIKNAKPGRNRNLIRNF